jgi:hypothetical protein
MMNMRQVDIAALTDDLIQLAEVRRINLFLVRNAQEGKNDCPSMCVGSHRLLVSHCEETDLSYDSYVNVCATS